MDETTERDGGPSAPRGSDDAFDDLFRREHAAILRAAFLVVRDREVAREVTQEAFIQLYVRWRRVSNYDRPGAWVRRVAIRLAVKEARRLDRRRRTVELLPADAHGPARGPDVEGALDLRTAIATLPPQQRAAIALHLYADLPGREIAEALGCSEATAKVHLHRARTRLAELLGEEVPDAV